MVKNASVKLDHAKSITKMLLFHFEVHLSVLKAWAKHFDMDKEAAFAYAVREQHCVVVTES